MSDHNTQNIDRYYKEPKFHIHTREHAKLWCCLHFHLYGAETSVRKWRSIFQPSAEHYAFAFTSELLLGSVERVFWKLFALLSEQTKGDEILISEFPCFIRRLLWSQIQLRILCRLSEHPKCDAFLTVCKLQYALWSDETCVMSAFSPNQNPHQFHLSSICSFTAGN